MTKSIILLIFLGVAVSSNGQSGFVKRTGNQFYIDNTPYHYIGTNYWYGGLIASRNDTAGLKRLRTELDFLVSKNVNNLRVLAGAEGQGLINGFPRVSPALQTSKGVFDTAILQGLDILLTEMASRKMKAVLFFSNNWEWSGGFLQYLNWNGLLPDSVIRRRMNWDEWRDYVSMFYSCTPCIADYKKQVAIILNRKNSISGKRYIDDPTIMAWELANEPRPMRPVANNAYARWIKETAAFIRSLDKKHMITLGHEGEIGTQSMPLYKKIHSDKNIDYLTIHIWPKNWAWFKDTSIHTGFTDIITKTQEYITKHEAMAMKLKKPLVIEEFGLPRNNQLYMPGTTTSLRDNYFQFIFQQLIKSAGANGAIAGVNFWAFGGEARPVPQQAYWKQGDMFMGDPPMEEQGLNTVFDDDFSTWNLIFKFSKMLPK